MRLDFSLQGLAALAVGSNDEDGVVTGDGAGDFGKFCAVDGGGEGLCPARRSLKDEKIFRRTNIEEELAESASKRRHGGVFGKQRGRTIAFAGLNELELMKIARERGLGNAHALLREAAAEVLLVGDSLRRDQAKDLAVTKCFGGAHCNFKYTPYCIFIQSVKESVKPCEQT